MSALQAILSNPAYHDYLAVLKGARHGFVYGVKVRFTHALIMAILFGRGESVFNGMLLCFLTDAFQPIAQLVNAIQNNLPRY